jgi:hypothetical protein
VTPAASRRRDAWFRRHPVLAAAVAVALYGLVFGLRAGADDNSGVIEAITMLYALPISLLAMAFGLRGGVAGGALGAVMVAVSAASSHLFVAPAGWFAWIAPMILLGVVLGTASDQLRDAADTERELWAASLRQREAAEINDAIVQGLAVAKWALESGATERSLEVLTTTMATAQQLVSDLLRDGDDQPCGRRVVAPANLTSAAG